MTGRGDHLGSWATGRIVANMAPLLLVLSVLVLWAGLTLEAASALLDRYALLAVMLPPMIGLGGNLGAILSSRLSTRLHLGTAEVDPRDPVLWADVGAVIALAVTLFTVLPVAAWLLGIVIDSSLGLLTLLQVSLVSGLVIATVAVLCSLLATYGAYRLGIDPDDTTIPIVTNVVDVCGLLVFVGVSTVLL
jgi:mgtE-like transporter